MGLNNLRVLYKVLLNFGITMVVDILKWEDQKSKSKHELVILIMLFKHILFLRIYLR